jgi:recombination protein RecA
MMAARVSIDDDDNVVEASHYFARRSNSIEFIPSGAAILDCTLGGGWPLSRISNIIGDESTGKTLMAIEACANFARKYPDGHIYYRESESAFDEPYAEALGMPLDRVQFIDPDSFVTVEDFYEDLCKAVDQTLKKDTTALYIVDSLDALSDKAEQGMAFDAGSYNTSKAKQMGKLLRMCKGEVAKARMCLIIISQTRDRITEGFMAKFAKKKTRSGGRALDFYASQCLWLSHLNTLTAQHAKIKRPVGIRIRAKCEKNKISLPLRDCEFTIRFGHGIDSLSSSLDWLEDVARWSDVIDVTRKTYLGRIDAMSDTAYWAEVRRVDEAVTKLWVEVEELFLAGTRHKYRHAEV